MNKLDVLSTMTNDEYRAFQDMVFTMKHEIDPASFKEICLDTYNYLQKNNIPMPVHFLQMLSGDPYCIMRIPMKEPAWNEKQVPYGEKMKAFMRTMKDTYFWPCWILEDSNSGDMYCTVVLDKNDCERHGVLFQRDEHGHTVGVPTDFEAIRFATWILPLTEMEKKRYFDELIDREIEVYGPEAVGLTPERAAKRKKEREAVKRRNGWL